MNISQLAKASDVSTDTVRYYEKQGLIAAPTRQINGYRAYTEAHVESMRFVRGAQSLGFSLTEIRAILPQFAAGQFGRADIEQQLNAKMAEIDAHIRQLQTLKKELKATFASLTCAPDQAVSTAQGTATDTGSGAGAAKARKSFTKPATQLPTPRF
ncbi:MAG: heavy metal-responsive transcriptional regulator [Rhodoferax sp.]|jgi:MerR family copper efflux transcriptional regulator